MASKQTIKFVFEMDMETWQGLDTQKERKELSQSIKEALKRAGTGSWVES